MKDVIVIGAGHNGLVAACYLARAGLSVTVIERRAVPGGAAVTEEIAPGFRVSSAAYALSLFRPDVFDDLGLAARGVVVRAKEPQMFVPLPGGRHFFVWRDPARTCAELERIRPGDGDAYLRWCAFWEGAVSLLRPLAEDPSPPRLEEVEERLRRAGREDVWRLAVAGSATECVSAFFRSPEIQGAFASQGVIGTRAPPSAAGTAWVMAYHALGGELIGGTGAWGWVEGGLGALTSALAAAAAGWGAEIRLSAEVDEVLVEEGRAAGVRLAGGEVVTSRVVASGADPVATFGKLVPGGALPEDFVRRIGSWRMDPAVVKVNLALGELPDFTAVPGSRPGPQHRGTVELSPSPGYLEDAFSEAEAGRYPRRPFMEVFLQSAVDPGLVSGDGHVLSAFTQWAPAGGAPDTEDVIRSVLETIGEHAPNVPGAVLAAQVLGPADLAGRFGLTGGDIFHGAIVPEQSFGERFAYRSPVAGLYLCGSGASPGGGVMGAAGRNAARAILEDLGV